jgi:hypothetical protein
MDIDGPDNTFGHGLRIAYERRKLSTNLACTFGAAERLVEIRDETISKHGTGEYEPRALNEAVVAVLEVRQKTRKASDFGTDPEELY